MKYAGRLVVVPAFVMASVLAAAATFSQSSIPLYSFSHYDGGFPEAPPVQGRDGNIYGTTSGGGAHGRGTVFKITPGGRLTTLHDFGGIDGSNSSAGLLEGADGNFYGTTIFGGIHPTVGAGGGGTVFKITPAGVLTTLYSFSGDDDDGAYPSGTLVDGGDGRFYGTTAGTTPHVGSHLNGTVFSITPAGSLTTLHRFNGSDGRYVYAGLARGDDGNFYGVTQQGGSTNQGTVFRITPSGSFATLHNFSGGDGERVYDGLVQGSDGSLYGTTYGGGTIQVSGNFHGTVFKITPSGHLTTLHSFSNNSTDGGLPRGVLVEGEDGSFYGTTTVGGDHGLGTVYRITAAGVVSTLYSFGFGYTFSDSDGAQPYAGLVQASNGSFYGTTYFGGASDFGTLFRLSLDKAPAREDQCKSGGWTTFSDPRAFRNQGDCMQFVNTGR